MKGALKAKSIFMGRSCHFDCMYYKKKYLKQYFISVISKSFGQK